MLKRCQTEVYRRFPSHSLQIDRGWWVEQWRRVHRELLKLVESDASSDLRLQTNTKQRRLIQKSGSVKHYWQMSDTSIVGTREWHGAGGTRRRQMTVERFTRRNRFALKQSKHDYYLFQRGIGTFELNRDLVLRWLLTDDEAALDDADVDDDDTDWLDTRLCANDDDLRANNNTNGSNDR
jgi:hypothetical protein